MALQKKSKSKMPKLKVIPLGGVDEIGKNITVFECENDIIVVDCGLTFPDDDMLGIDIVIPDFSYLIQQKHKIRGIILTHGHEDHIGALPYFLKDINVPVYGTKLTLGLLGLKLKEHNLLDTVQLNLVEHHGVIELGLFSVEFIPVCHSIPDTSALAIYTPLGTVLYMSDFKIDHTPIDDVSMDLARIAEIGTDGVLLMMCDSTNVERKGYTMSEKVVGESFEQIFMEAKGRLLVTTFASNVHRIQQVIDASVKYKRKVAVAGRSMENVISLAVELGHISAPNDIFISLDRLNKYNPEQLCILTTGSQGEPMSALTRIASSDYRRVVIGPGDTVVISASAIPGNEKLISNVINDLFRKGANVVYEKLAEIHVSGHACEEELKLIHFLIKPQYFMPIHGEYRHLVHHARLAKDMGMKWDDIFIMDAGNVLEISYNNAAINGTVHSGQVFVDGLGVGDVGNDVIRDRKHLSEDGMVLVVIAVQNDTGNTVSNLEIITKGFVNSKDSELVLDRMKDTVLNTINSCKKKGNCDWNARKSIIRDRLRDYIFGVTKRRPMIIPVIIEV